MGNVLGIVGFCYACGYEGKMYPRYCRKEKGNPTWEAYKKGKQDRKNGVCNMSEAELEKQRKNIGNYGNGGYQPPLKLNKI